jgi:hypothetical protein
MAKMGDWRENKDEEIELDGIGGVSILVKADVHRSGEFSNQHSQNLCLTWQQASTSPATLSRTRPRPKALRKWPSVQATRSSAYRITLSGISIQMRRAEMSKEHDNARSRKINILLAPAYVRQRSGFEIATLFRTISGPKSAIILSNDRALQSSV